MNDGAPDLKTQTKREAGRLRQLFGQTQLSILWERFWRKLWPSLAVAAVFVSIALFDLLPHLPMWLHWLVLLGFAVLLAACLRPVVAGDYRVSDKEIRDRIEQESGLQHRPLTTLNDHLVATPAGARKEQDAARLLWQTHQARAADKISGLRAPTPRPGLAARDLFGGRLVLLLLMVVALASANGNVRERLARAVLPSSAVADSGTIDFDVWITPPAYTGLAPLFLEKAAAPNAAQADRDTGQAMAPVAASQPLHVPVGSTVLVQMSGSDTVPQLHVGARSIGISRVGPTESSRDFRVEDTIVNGDVAAPQIRLMIADQIFAEWPVYITRDAPPVLELTEPPKRARRASLGLKFEARDDLSVKDVWAEIELPGQESQADEADRIRFDLTATGYGTPVAQGRGERDYSAHRWAGLAVHIRLFAKDSAGQIGESEAVETILPARTFNHPVARALVEIRKDLNRPTTDVVEQSMETILGLLQRPTHFAHDTVVFLSMSVARSRLRNSQSEDSVESVQDLLWETALRIEDGEFSIAERDLRDIQERLAEAMRENAPSEELDRLMDELQQALNTYMQALAEHMERQGLSAMPMDPNMQSMESMDLQNMIDRARQLAKTGAMDAAKQMLSQLNRMLEGLKNGTAMTRQNQDMAKARKMMDQMRGLAQRQQQLMDQTFRQSQSNPQAQPGQQQQQLPQLSPRPGQRPGQMPGQQQTPQPGGQGQGDQDSLEAMRKQQDALRKELGRLMLQMNDILGGIPPGLGQAERSMKGAGESLGEGAPGDAVPQQADALEKLQQGMESAAEQMAQRMQGQGMGIGMGMMPGGQRGGQRRGDNRDPFGRQNGEGQFGSVNDDDGIKVPTEREIYRAREIMEELHRRSGESGRQKPERDYIDRLLRRF